MKVLLTGAVGRLGAYAWQTLLDAGHEVRATDVQYRRERPGPLEVVDLTDTLACYRLVDGCDAIVHLGNIPHMFSTLTPQTVYRTNVLINFNLFQAAYEAGVNNIAFASTVQVIAGRRTEETRDQPSILPYLPADGDLPAQPGNAYALSKQASEDMLRHYARINEAGSYAAFRFPWLLADEDVERMLAYMANRPPRKRSRRRSTMLIDEAMSFLLFDDAAELLLRAIDRPRPGYRQYFPSAQQMRPGWTVEQAIEQTYPGVPLRKPVEQMSSLVDITALREDFDWEPAHTTRFMRQIGQQVDALNT